MAAGGLVDFLPDDVAESFSFHRSPRRIAEQLRSVLTIVPEASIVVPHPVPTPPMGSALDYARWFCDRVLTAT